MLVQQHPLLIDSIQYHIHLHGVLVHILKDSLACLSFFFNTENDRLLKDAWKMSGSFKPNPFIICSF
jgi:hypothetical protein